MSPHRRARTIVHSFAFALVFVVLCFLGIGFWAVSQRSAIRAPFARDATEDAKALLSFASEYEPHELETSGNARSSFQALVAERGVVGALLLDTDGNVLARGGVLEKPVVDAALEEISAKPASRALEQRILFREAEEPYIAIVIEDVAPLEAAWRPAWKTARLLGILAVLVSPLFGWLGARALARVRELRPSAPGA